MGPRVREDDTLAEVPPHACHVCGSAQRCPYRWA